MRSVRPQANGSVQVRLQEMGLVAKRSLGQNFLQNPHVIEKIVSEVQAHTFHDLIEIGPGLGAITEPLLALSLKPQIIELDDDFAAYWSKRGLHVHHHDALKVDWERLNLRASSLLVSNLPYQISTHLVIDRCFGPSALQVMVLMFQKEVAQRLMAKPRTGDYGMLSVMAQLHFRIHKVADAAPRDFFPAPKVASRVLAFERRSDVAGLGLPFFKMVKAAFAFRRKFLIKNLGGALPSDRLEQLPDIFKSLKISPKARAEELSPEEFVGLYRLTQKA